jgi:polyhydroxyalkanoate synthesis repressor PhaR
MPDPTVIIKKYENRRLYDTSNSRYVNLDDIAEMVRDGTEIRVIDAATGEDLTRLVLTQIIVESAKVPDSPFPVDMLRQMIIASGRLSQEGLRSYMKAAFDLYQNTYRAFAQGLSPFAAVQQLNPEPTAGSSGRGSMPEEKSAPPRGAYPNAPVEDLRRRIEELELLVAKSGRSRPAVKRNRRSRRKK